MFGCVVEGLPVSTDCIQIEPLKWLFSTLNLPAPHSHLTVFALGPLPAAQAAAIYVQVAGEWQYIDALGPGKLSAVFSLPEASVHVPFSIGISLQSPESLPQASPALTLAKPSLVVETSKQLLRNFTNYALSFAQVMHVPGDAPGTAYVPVRVVNDWLDKTMRKAQLDPEGFVQRLSAQEN
jgi:hypothetical protein